MFEALVLRLAIDSEACSRCCTSGKTRVMDAAALEAMLETDAMLDFLEHAAEEGEHFIVDIEDVGDSSTIELDCGALIEELEGPRPQLFVAPNAKPKTA